MFLQLIYVSSVNAKAGPVDSAAILATSRRNNAQAQVTGALYSDGTRFMQVLEGPEAAVTATLTRITADPRHHAIVELSRRTLPEREFGRWDMAHRARGADADAFIAEVAGLVAHASPDVRATFESFAELRRAA